MFDICVNLQSERFDHDRDEVIEKAFQQGVEYIALTGSNLPSSYFALEYSQKDPSRFCATAGIHPHEAQSFCPELWKEISILATNPLIKAVGECGLDYFRNFSSPEIQKKCFQAHIRLAQELGKPLFLHQRDAFTEFIDILDEERAQVPVVVHCFTDGKEQLLALLDRGYFIGITGWICDDRRNQALLEAIHHLPLERMMIETDSPWLTPRHLKKIRRNEPSFLSHVVSRISRETGHTEEDIIFHSTQNAKHFFGI